MAVARLVEHFGLSKQRACDLVDLQRSTLHYRSKRKNNDEPIIKRMKEIVEKYRSWGCPSIHEVLRRENLVINHKKTSRIYNEQGLSLKIRKRKKRASQTRLKLPLAAQPNQRWSMDFVQAALWNGRRFRMLTIVDNFTKECPIIEVDTSINGMRVSRILEWVSLTHGLPEVITVDNGPEFAGIVLDRWAYKSGVKLDFIRPGKPVENAFIESFNGRLRHECLNQHYFVTLEEAKSVIESWRLDYNSFRPHSSLRGLTPKDFRKQWQDKNNNLNTQKLYLEPVQLQG